MENLGIASVAAITVITYLMGMAVRASRMDNKWISSPNIRKSSHVSWNCFACSMPDFHRNK